MEDLQSYGVIGAAMAVHGELGEGYLERTYQEALALEFEARGVPFQREVSVPVRYRGVQLGGRFRADFVCFGSLVVELKALPSVGDRQIAQLAHYLAATGLPTGLLLNFGAGSLQFRRVKPRRSKLPPLHSGESAESPPNLLNSA